MPRLESPQPGDKVLAADESGALHRALGQSLKGQDNSVNCDEFNDQSELTISRLSGGKLLVSTDCWMAAYNGGSGYWVIDGQAPFHPVLVTTDANAYANGVITSTQQGRGVGDCLGFDAWYWNGSRFVYGVSGATGQCKGILGGAWDMPTLVIRSWSPWFR